MVCRTIVVTVRLFPQKAMWNCVCLAQICCVSLCQTDLTNLLSLLVKQVNPDSTLQFTSCFAGHTLFDAGYGAKLVGMGAEAGRLSSLDLGGGISRDTASC